MQNFLDRIAQIVGAQHLITAAAATQKYTAELRQRYASECRAVVLPADPEQVAAVVTCCAAAKVSMVPQGGNTGAVGGAVARREQVIINLGRMNRILEVDAANYSMRVQAGCVLADIQQAARRHERFFPLSLGAQGSCQIGGNLATNAGGINVLRYGSARDLTLGLEAVLADGRRYCGLSNVRKNNTGYDLKNLFIGSEGTLGIITAADLKLFPLARAQAAAVVGLQDADSALALLSSLRAATGDCLTTFELMANIAVQAAVAHIPRQSDPLPQQHPWYALIVATTSHTAAESDDAETALQRQLESCLAQAMQQDIVQDAALATNDRQAQQLLRLRENIVTAQAFEGGSIKHDISVPLAQVPEFLRRAQHAVQAAMPGARPYAYGHMGDGNIHFNISQPPDMERAAFLAQAPQIHERVHEIVHQLNGSFSAEHGIGIAKLDDMKKYKDAVSLALYQQIKRAFDPHNLFNPGKVNP